MSSIPSLRTWTVAKFVIGLRAGIASGSKRRSERIGLLAGSAGQGGAASVGCNPLRQNICRIELRSRANDGSSSRGDYELVLPFVFNESLLLQPLVYRKTCRSFPSDSATF